MAQNTPYLPSTVPAVRIDGGIWLSVNQLAVTTEAQLVVDYNPTRRGLVITNTGTTTVYVSSYPSVTAVTGYPILAGGSLSIGASGPVYVIAAADGNTIGWAEEVG